jgi:hypothetical protein
MFSSIYRFPLVFSSVRHQVVSDPVEVPDINTLFPITIPGELASNIGLGIDRKTDTQPSGYRALPPQSTVAWRE